MTADHVKLHKISKAVRERQTRRKPVSQMPDPGRENGLPKMARETEKASWAVGEGQGARSFLFCDLDHRFTLNR